jgi:CRP/FNR family transcriptional regulator, anaerobic regulatory protein
MRGLQAIKERLNLLNVHASEEEIREIITYLKLEVFKRNDYLQKVGEVNDKAYFIVEGITRSFHIETGLQRTDWFFYEKDTIREESFILQQPATTNIVCVTEVKAWTITHECFQKLLAENRLGDKIMRIINEYAYMKIFNVMKAMKHKPAAERYQWYISRYPQAAKYIPVGQLASFLGIAIETLSRIRSKK